MVGETSSQRSIAQPPTRVPSGLADQAITMATLITRPSMWPGTIACRRLPVLILNMIVRPICRAQSATPSQYQGVSARAVVSRPESISAPSATLLKPKRLRSAPAASDITTTPALPAE